MSPQSGEPPKKGSGEERKRKNLRPFRKGDGRQRGPKFDVKAGQDIVAAMRLGSTFDVAALAAGITRGTYYNWRRRAKRSDAPPELKKWLADIRAALARGELFNLQRVHQAADKGIWQAAAWLLERRYPERYGRREHVEHSGGVEGRGGVSVILQVPDNGRGPGSTPEASPDDDVGDAPPSPDSNGSTAPDGL